MSTLCSQSDHRTGIATIALRSCFGFLQEPYANLTTLHKTESEHTSTCSFHSILGIFSTHSV